MDIAGLDKLLHIAMSYLIALVDPALALFAGFGKELCDYSGRGTADAFDLAADLLGIVLAL